MCHHLVQLAPGTSPGEHFKSSLKLKMRGGLKGRSYNYSIISGSSIIRKIILVMKVFCLQVWQCYLSAFYPLEWYPSISFDSGEISWVWSDIENKYPNSEDGRLVGLTVLSRQIFAWHWSRGPRKEGWALGTITSDGSHCGPPDRWWWWGRRCPCGECWW